MKYRLINCCLGALAGFGLFGCSTHPLPQDVARVSTVDIVRRIRCEAKEGLEEALQRAAEHGALRKAHVEKIVKLTTIGYEFTFMMSEDNRVTATELSFEKAASNPGDGFKLTLIADLKGGDQKTAADNSRVNKRIFRVMDKLGDLRKAGCNQVDTTRANPIYPMTGSTGMAEVVRTYIELETITDLKNPETKAGKEMIAFSDQLDFTTTFEAGAASNWELGSKHGTFKLTKASLSGSARRQDMHSVTVALARENESVDPDLPERARSLEFQRNGAAIPRQVATSRQLQQFPIQGVRGKHLQTFLVQRAAVARNRVLIELERRRHVNENRDVAARVLGQPVP